MMIMVLKIKLHVCGNYVYIVQMEVGGGISAYQKVQVGYFCLTFILKLNIRVLLN